MLLFVQLHDHIQREISVFNIDLKAGRITQAYTSTSLLILNVLGLLPVMFLGWQFYNKNFQ